MIHLVFALGLSSIFAAITREPDGFFRCPIDPITLKYPDSNDKTCIHYFICHRGHAFPMKCPLRFAFHPAIGECIPRTEVPENICKFEIKCGFNGYYPDPLDCTRYYICFYQQPVHFGCTSEYVYIPSKFQCVKNKTKALECSKPRPLPQFIPINPTAKLTLKKPTLPPKLTPTKPTLPPKLTPTKPTLPPKLTPTKPTLPPKLTPTKPTLPPKLTPTITFVPK